MDESRELGVWGVDVVVLEEHGTLHRFSPGEIIFNRGDEGQHMYVVDSGQVEIVLGHGAEEVRLSVLGPEEIFGEMALFGGGRRSATARALDKCAVRVISKDDIYDIVRDQLARHLLVTQGQRLREVDAKLEQLANERDLTKQHVRDLIAFRARSG